MSLVEIGLVTDMINDESDEFSDRLKLFSRRSARLGWYGYRRKRERERERERNAPLKLSFDKF